MVAGVDGNCVTSRHVTHVSPSHCHTTVTCPGRGCCSPCPARGRHRPQCPQWDNRGELLLGNCSTGHCSAAPVSRVPCHVSRVPCQWQLRHSPLTVTVLVQEGEECPGLHMGTIIRRLVMTGPDTGAVMDVMECSLKPIFQPACCCRGWTTGGHVIYNSVPAHSLSWSWRHSDRASSCWSW